MKRSRLHLSWCVLGLAVAVVAPLRAATNEPAPGAAETPAVRTAPPAPAFKLQDLDGHEVKSADFDGRPLLICFWASWDKPSVRQLPVLRALQQQYKDKAVQVIGISLDTKDRDELRAFVKEQGVSFPVLLFDLKVVEGFGGIKAIPTTFLIDRNHNIIERYVGFVERKEIETGLQAVLAVKQ